MSSLVSCVCVCDRERCRSLWKALSAGGNSGHDELNSTYRPTLSSMTAATDTFVDV